MLSLNRLVAKRNISQFLHISPNIQKALKKGEGVVALESTVITHGLPFPHNLRTAQELEEQVRNGGSHPATIALFDGEIHVGLEEKQLEMLAKSKSAVKVSTRDIARTLVSKQIGGTTVASTMKIAHAAGIRVFATGGIGGVHRGADQTFDISADLQELSKTPVCVVCAGVKSILDISKTVEYLETHSVNCIVYGTENVFPSFFTRKSNSKGQFNTEELEDVVKVLDASKDLDLPYGTILAVPIPEEFAANGKLIQDAIDQALKESKEKNITSQGVTPFLLARVNELTKGASMVTNIALLKNNALVAGRLADKMSSKNSETRSRIRAVPPTPIKIEKPKIVCVGATIVDFEAITTDDIKEDGGSYTGEMVQRMGGVGRNHADGLARLGCESILLSAVGNDPNADYFRQQCQHIDISRVRTLKNAPTCTYLSMNSHGNVKYGLTTCEPLLHLVTPELITDNEDVFESSNYVVLDGNMPVPVIRKTVELAKKYQKPVWFEPTDIKKVCKIFDAGSVNNITAASPNANEFLEWIKLRELTSKDVKLVTNKDVMTFIKTHEKAIMGNLNHMIVTLAHNGSVLISRKNQEFEYMLHNGTIEQKDIVSVSGAGDSFNCGIIVGLLHGKPLFDCVKLAEKCADLTLRTTLAISKDMTPELVSKYLDI